MNKTIILTDDQFAALQNGESITIEPPKPEVKVWEPEGGNWTIFGDGAITEAQSIPRFALYGAERPTKEQAIAARDKMHTFNRILAYVDEKMGAEEWSTTGMQQYWFHYNGVGVAMYKKIKLKLEADIKSGVVLL